MGEELRFDGRVAIVTGGGRGMGRYHALLLAERGASVVVNDAGVEMDGTGGSHEPAESVVAEIRAAGGEATADFGDVGLAETAPSLVEKTLDTYGRLDIVVNNAGIIRYGSFAEVTDTDLTRTVEVHLYGTMRVSQAAWPHLVDAGYGRIVNVTSHSIFGQAENSPYMAAKSGIFGLTRAIALEGEAHGIKANAITPVGWTRMVEAAADLIAPEDLEFAQAAMPPTACAAVVAFLSHESCPLTSEVLSYSGSRLARWVLSETEGLELDVNERLTPETVVAGLDQVLDMEQLHQFGNLDEWFQYSQEKIRAKQA